MSNTLVPCASCGGRHYEGSQNQRLCQKEHSGRDSTRPGASSDQARSDLAATQRPDDPDGLVSEMLDSIPDEGANHALTTVKTTLDEYEESGLPWTDAEYDCLEKLEQIDQALAEDSPESLARAKEIYSSVPSPRSILDVEVTENNDNDSRMDYLPRLAEAMIANHENQRNPIPTAPPRTRNDALVGTDIAQDIVLETENASLLEFLGSYDHGPDALQHRQEAADVAAQRGYDNHEHPDDVFTSRESLIRAFEINQQDYLCQVFPDTYLREAMQTYGVDSVSVSPLVNGRERGLVYTVSEPDGHRRSFAVYEHRNTDSIIINGTTDWDGQDLPYAGDSSSEFFAEIPYKQFRQAADTLCFFMSSAQRGELDDDQTLVKGAPRVDWAARLSETLPGFREFYETNYPAEAAQRAGTSDEDVLRNLDFDA